MPVLRSDKGCFSRQNISGEVCNVRVLSSAAALTLGGLSLWMTCEFDLLYNGALHLFWRQALFLTLGLLLTAHLAFAPPIRAFARLGQHAIWVAFVLGLLLFLVGQAPGTALKIGNQQRWVQLFGLKLNTAIWAGLLLLPGIVHWLAQKLTLKSLLALSATLVYVNLSLINTRNTPAIFWFNGAVGLMVLASLHPLFRGNCMSSRHQSSLRLGFLSGLVAFGTAPMFRHSYRIKQLFLAWMPQCQEKHDHLYFAWAAHQNFINGGLWGSGEPFTASQLIGVKADISDFVLQVIGFRFGILGVLTVIALCLCLACLWIRHAMRGVTPYQRLLRLGLAAFLLFHIFGSIARTTALLPIVPPLPFSFLAYGGNITLWSFVCLGFLLRNHAPNVQERAKEIQCA